MTIKSLDYRTSVSHTHRNYDSCTTVNVSTHIAGKKKKTFILWPNHHKHLYPSYPSALRKCPSKFYAAISCVPIETKAEDVNLQHIIIWCNIAVNSIISYQQLNFWMIKNGFCSLVWQYNPFIIYKSLFDILIHSQ